MGMVFDRVEGIGFVYCVQFISQLLIVNVYKKPFKSRLFPVDLDAPAWIWKGFSY